MVQPRRAPTGRARTRVGSEQPFHISCGRRLPTAFLARLDLAHGAEETQADAACIRSQESRGRGVRRRPGSPELPPNRPFPRHRSGWCESRALPRAHGAPHARPRDLPDHGADRSTRARCRERQGRHRYATRPAGNRFGPRCRCLRLDASWAVDLVERLRPRETGRDSASGGSQDRRARAPFPCARRAWRRVCAELRVRRQEHSALAFPPARNRRSCVADRSRERRQRAALVGIPIARRTDQRRGHGTRLVAGKAAAGRHARECRSLLEWRSLTTICQPLPSALAMTIDDLNGRYSAGA